MDARTRGMSPRLRRAALRAHIEDQYHPTKEFPPDEVVLRFLQADLDCKILKESRIGEKAARKWREKWERDHPHSPS